jgi:hypothetical protein
MDPIGIAGGLNVYGFANGDPINFSDPFGLDCRTRSGGRCPSYHVGVGVSAYRGVGGDAGVGLTFSRSEGLGLFGRVGVGIGTDVGPNVFAGYSTSRHAFDDQSAGGCFMIACGSQPVGPSGAIASQEGTVELNVPLIPEVSGHVGRTVTKSVTMGDTFRMLLGAFGEMNRRVNDRVSGPDPMERPGGG